MVNGDYFLPIMVSGVPGGDGSTQLRPCGGELVSCCCCLETVNQTTPPFNRLTRVETLLGDLQTLMVFGMVPPPPAGVLILP